MMQDMNGVAEPGKFEAMIGSSSRNIKGTIVFELK